MSSIIKVPCILLAAIAIHTSLTPPHQASKSDRAPPRVVSTQFLQFALGSLLFVKGVFWSVALAEIVVILAKASPSNVSAHIPSALAINGSPLDLRITPIFLVGITLISFGTLIRVSCYRALKKFFTFEANIRQGHRLVTSGPYSIVRHPSYTGMLMMDIGILFWFGDRGSFLRESGLLVPMTGKVFFGIFGAWLLVALVALFKRATVEDAVLQEKFSNEWNEWAKRVPYAFIPGVY